MKLTKLFAALTLLVTVAACDTSGGNEKETVGTLLGAAGGALLGAQFGGGSGKIAAGVIGGLAGAYLGNQIGASMDKADRQYATQTTQNSLEYSQNGQVSTWSNPDTGNSGSVLPTQTYRGASGEDCRDFETTINVDGQTEVGTGTACRDVNGTWRITN